MIVKKLLYDQEPTEYREQQGEKKNRKEHMRQEVIVLCNVVRDDGRAILGIMPPFCFQA